MQCIYQPADMAEGELLRQILSERRIHCHLSGQYLQGAIGELPVQGLLGLWVPADDADLACELIRSWQQAEPAMPHSDDPEQQPDYEPLS